VLLFDQNISYRIVQKLEHLYPKCTQVRIANLENATDNRLWLFAKEHNYTIVTFDADFFDLANLYGHPPKIIWLRTGNSTTDALAKLLTDRLDTIKDFIENPENNSAACLELE
jgi:predicted nuclease of predicted toxin-antitoxin system